MESLKNELAFFESLMQAITSLLGPASEVVLQERKIDRDSHENIIIGISNGHVTSRSVGDTAGELGMEIRPGIENENGRYNYAVQTRNGRVFRCSSIYIRNNEEEIIGTLNINFDISDLMLAEKALSSIIMNPLSAPLPPDEKHHPEFATNDVTELLDLLIQESHKHVNKPVAHMTKEDKMVALNFLDERGAFLVKKSGDRIAQFYDMSKYTMYSYLEEIRTGQH